MSIPQPPNLFVSLQHFLAALQVAQYKYVVNVEGNCAALRLKYLLAGPSAVFFVQSDEIEWFYPLLKPFVHYIPVTFRRAGEDHGVITGCLSGRQGVCCWEIDKRVAIPMITAARYMLLADG